MLCDFHQFVHIIPLFTERCRHLFFFTSFLDIFLLTIFYYEVEFYIYFSPRGFLCTLFSELFQTWACLPIALTLKKKKQLRLDTHFLSVFSGSLSSGFERCCGKFWVKLTFHLVSDSLFLNE